MYGNKSSFIKDLEKLKEKIDILLQLEVSGMDNDVVRQEIIKKLIEDSAALEEYFVDHPIDYSKVY